MRLLLVGAFPYPHHQGSQVYFQEQAHALRAAGAEVELLTYATGLDPAAHPRALEGFVHHTPPARTAPARLASGPSWGKPRADLALASKLRQTLASKTVHDAHDAILTHNAEAGLAALIGLRGTRPAHVHCPHTLLGQELGSYFKYSKRKRFSSPTERPGALRRGLDGVGRSLDRGLARRVDGWIALTHASHRVMRQYSTAPGARIAPPIPDPREDPERLDPFACAVRHDLEPEGYFLYSGNLDGYQELEILAAAAGILTEAIPDAGRRPRLVVASHDPSGEARVARMPGVEFRYVATPAEMQALVRVARANLLMRLAEGGYPIKLANAHALGTPSIVFHGREWGLSDGRDALVAAADRPADSLASAVLRLAGDAELLARLRVGARTLYETQHRPDDVAQQTLALIEKVLAVRRGASTRSHGRAR